MSPTRQVLVALLICTVLLAILWGLDLLVLRTPVLTPLPTPAGDRPALTPLYAFLIPRIRWTAWMFPLLAAGVAAAGGRLVDPGRTGRTAFSLVLLAAAVLLPVALFLVRQPAAVLGFQFNIYPGEEFYYDAVRIPDLAGGLGGFLRRYPDLMPELSLHGKHFPPGHATFLYGVRRLLGETLAVSGWTVLATFAVGMVFSFRAFLCLGGETAARAGTLLLLACPSVLDFACTSMDAVFFAVAALALWLSLAALTGGSRYLLPVAAGAALGLAAFFSFSVLPLGLLVLLFGLIRRPEERSAASIRIGLIGTGFLAFTLLLYLATGFTLWRCFLVAVRLNHEFMTAVIGRSPFALYPFIAYGNLAAFLIGAGLGIAASLALRLSRGGIRRDPFLVATLATLAVMAFGGIYVMETERIWLFAVPWIGAAAAGVPGTASGRNLVLAAGLIQAWVMEILLFTLW